MRGRPPTRKKGAYTAAERMRRYRRRLKRARPDPKTVAKQERRAERERALASATLRASQVLGAVLYGVLYVDPPWDFLVYSRETGMDRHVANHYPVKSLDDLATLKLPAAKDCVLYLWATVSRSAHAFRLIEAWGFEYQSKHIWAKPDCGTGYWGRENAEELLIATRGSVPCPAPGDQLPYVIEAPRGPRDELSKKPEIFAEMIERHWPNTPKLEMFARRPRDDWDVWATKYDRPPDPDPRAYGGAFRWFHERTA